VLLYFVGRFPYLLVDYTLELGLGRFFSYTLFLLGTVCLRMQVNPANKEFKVWSLHYVHPVLCYDSNGCLKSCAYLGGLAIPYF